jgi:hypothetical protein
VEVIAASEIDPETISRCDSRDRRPAPYRQQRKAIEECRIGFRLDRTKVEIGHQRAGVSGCHTRMNAERLRAGAGSDHLFASTDFANESERPVLDQGQNRRGGPQCRRLRFVRVARRFRSPPELPHWRLRVNGERRDLRLDLFARLGTGSRPAGTGAPTAAPSRHQGRRRPGVAGPAAQAAA